MIPQEKAKELVDKFRNEYKWVETSFPTDLYRESKQCALICVDEIIKALNLPKDLAKGMYWLDVKKEIEKL